MAKAKVLIIGGGPAGSIAALTLNRLGHDAVIFERETFPRYRVGESLLPGTLSILHRLGLQEKIDQAGFVKKPSATFLWGQDQAPWTFSFTTPKVTDWIFDHAIQVKREEFDGMLLDEAAARGVEVHEGWPVRDIDLSSPGEVRLQVDTPVGRQTIAGDYLIDASGATSMLVRKLDLRRYDPFYKSLAVWSYFRRPDPFKGDLRGTTFSITFEDGWVWMIPLKGDLYSVGVIVDQSQAEALQSLGAAEFYRRTLGRCRRAMDILDGAEMVDEVRVVRDWSYDTRIFSKDRFFICGDAACFTDPLFSQGVHLATQSAVCAAAAVDRIEAHPAEAAAVHGWYGRSYGETYEQYHEFLASFYTFASFTEPSSTFWRRRRIDESDDARFERRQWFHRLARNGGNRGGDGATADDWDIADFRDRASTMIAIGRHQRQELSDEFSDGELGVARMRWISRLNTQLNTIARLEWNGRKVVLQPYYKVHPTSFRLEPKFILANENGTAMTKYAVSEEHAAVFRNLLQGELGYKAVIRRLSGIGARDTSSQMVIRLFEAGLLSGFDKDGKPVHIQDRLRFDGVGVEYEV